MKKANFFVKNLRLKNNTLNLPKKVTRIWRFTQYLCSSYIIHKITFFYENAPTFHFAVKIILFIFKHFCIAVLSYIVWAYGSVIRC